MSNFIKDMENIKTFHKFLGIVITQVEKGEKVDFKSINNLSKIINTYFEEFDSIEEPETDSPESEECKNISESFEEKVNEKPVEKDKKEDKFLTDILSDNYISKKSRILNTTNYTNFKNNHLFY